MPIWLIPDRFYYVFSSSFRILFKFYMSNYNCLLLFTNGDDVQVNYKNKHNSKITKDEMNKITTKIDDALVKFIRQGKYKEVLMSIGNLSNYSLNNQIYILMQNENARTTYGLRKWNSLGRRVKPQEKAIKIFAPIIKKIDDDNEEIRVVGYKLENVFDISQTLGKELEVFKFDESKVINNKDKIINSLKNTISKYGFNVVYVSKEELGEEVYGLCNHKLHSIKILESMSDLQEISTLIHECGHALAHHETREDFKGLTSKEVRQIKEVEAESIACIVSSYLSLDTENFNFSYITAWSNGDIKLFRKNMDIISKYACILINGINDKYNNI